MSNHSLYTHPSGPVTTVCGKYCQRGRQRSVNVYTQYNGLCETVNTKSGMSVRSDPNGRLTRKTSWNPDLLWRRWEWGNGFCDPIPSRFFFVFAPRFNCNDGSNILRNGGRSSPQYAGSTPAGRTPISMFGPTPRGPYCHLHSCLPTCLLCDS